MAKKLHQQRLRRTASTVDHNVANLKLGPRSLHLPPTLLPSRSHVSGAETACIPPSITIDTGIMTTNRTGVLPAQNKARTRRMAGIAGTVGTAIMVGAVSLAALESPSSTRLDGERSLEARIEAAGLSNSRLTISYTKAEIDILVVSATDCAESVSRVRTPRHPPSEFRNLSRNGAWNACMVSLRNHDSLERPWKSRRRRLRSG